ncbi:MAG: aminomethyltransferase family protein [Pseudomonadota bacterium]
MTNELTAPGPHVQQGLLPTPFFERLNAFSKTKNWEDWAGFLSPSEFQFVEQEYFAVRNAATLFDISPMCKYRISGPDALRVVNRLVTRDVSKIRVGRVGYAMWCDEEGMVIDDGTIFRLSEDDFLLLCQERMYSWLHDTAWGFDAAITDESEALCGLSLQGPTSYSILDAAGLSSLKDLKPFDLRNPEPDLWVSRTGYTGDLGYEFLTKPEHALALWDRLWEAGRLWGLIPIGTAALDLVRLEAGFIAPGQDFQLVHHAERLGRGRTPFELGFENLVHFDKGHFNGRRALLKHRASGPRKHLVRLDIEGKDPAEDAFVYTGRGKKVGHVTSAAWSPTAKRNIALAELDAPYGGSIRQGLWVEIDVEKEGVWKRREAKVTVVDGPFFKNRRARVTPPGPY